VSLPELSSDRPRGVLVRKPQNSVYTVLLLIALLAMAFSCFLLFLELWQYGPIWEMPWNVPSNLRAAIVLPFEVANV
jgi:hypothetical protein